MPWASQWLLARVNLIRFSIPTMSLNRSSRFLRSVRECHVQ
jgi:hypothetical protein